ncbi:TPA: response regulator [Candidatus Woesearchaeota archaeon]|nr:response regulator [Candidatus Woesearchaeota archaeon]
MKKILVVEDNKDMQEIYRDLLKDKFEVIITGNTIDAEKELSRQKIDILILDIILPGEAGDTFLARMKQKDEYQNLSVIAITVLGDLTEHMRQVHQRLICIPKPFEKEQLIEAIARILE